MKHEYPLGFAENLHRSRRLLSVPGPVPGQQPAALLALAPQGAGSNVQAGVALAQRLVHRLQGRSGQQVKLPLGLVVPADPGTAQGFIGERLTSIRL